MAKENYTREELQEIIEGLEFELEYCTDNKKRVELIVKLDKYQKLLNRIEMKEKTGIYGELDIELDPPEGKDYSQETDIELRTFDSNKTSFGRPEPKLGGIFSAAKGKTNLADLRKTPELSDTLGVLGYTKDQVARIEKPKTPNNQSITRLWN